MAAGFIFKMEIDVPGMGHTPAISAFGKLTKEDLCKFEATLGYEVGSRPARAAQGDPGSKRHKKMEMRHVAKFIPLIAFALTT